MVANDWCIKMELKFHNAVILSKFDGKSSKVDQVIFSAPIGIPNMKALAKIFLRYLAHKVFKFCFSKGHNSTRGPMVL